MNALEQAVTKAADGTYGFQCPGVAGSPCGPFSSTGWPLRKHATARGEQHFAEHKGEGVMPSLGEFRAEHGLTVADDGTVSMEDI